MIFQLYTSFPAHKFNISTPFPELMNTSSLLFAFRNGFVRTQRKIRQQQKKAQIRRKLFNRQVAHSPGLRLLHNDIRLEKVNVHTGQVVDVIGLSSRQWSSDLAQNPYVSGASTKTSIGHELAKNSDSSSLPQEVKSSP